MFLTKTIISLGPLVKNLKIKAVTHKFLLNLGVTKLCDDSSHLLEVPVLVFAVGLQDNRDGGHKRFDHAELQSGLFTEAQEADGVGFSPQAAGSIHATGPDDTNNACLISTAAFNITLLLM